jgi:histidinol-phosphate aminotransferase
MDANPHHGSAVAVRRAIDSLLPYSTGRDAETVRYDSGFRGDIVKLASNEGAEGPFPEARRAIEQSLEAAQRYPAAGARALSAALADYHGVGPEQVLVAAGGCAVLHHLASALLEEHDEVAFCSPTFHLYRLEALRAGAGVATAPLAKDGAYDLAALESRITERTKLVYVCTPNNPTGGLVSREALRRFLERVPSHVLPVIDEAYFEFVDSPEYPEPWRVQAPADRPVVIMRTFSKVYGLAGLRVGYALAPPAIVKACQKVQNPYEVNCLAQVAALASLRCPEELARRVKANQCARTRLLEGLKVLGLKPLPSQANFVCVEVGSAMKAARTLEAHGIIVRPLDAMGDAHSIRITVGTEREVDAFLGALASELEVLRGDAREA